MRAAIYTTSVGIKYFIEEVLVLVLYIVQKQEEVSYNLLIYIYF